MRYLGRNVVMLTACALWLGAPRAAAGVAQTRHNFSASGPGSLVDAATGEVCVFCHTPHHASPSRALWNRDLPGTVYRLYSSSTLDATLNQPTGSSRLCLSCHDGTVAVGLLRVPSATRTSSLGPLGGRASLGTDLSDDHPVSFVYDARLAARQGRLVLPASLPRSLPLDEAGQMQCTTCHDPHEETFPKFLRMDTRSSALCTACHVLEGWPESSHATAAASWSGRGVAPWPSDSSATVASHGCDNCHRMHAAAHPQWLLADRPAVLCLSCHNGTTASRNLEPEFLKPSAHPVSNEGHNPAEDPRTMPRHVACADCHNPHQVQAAVAVEPSRPGPWRGVSGVDLSGAPIPEARSEYEVCFKCHGLRDQTAPGIIRQDNTRNVRLEIDPGNASYHPIAAIGKAPDLQDLQPGLTASSLVRCTDCHNTDEASTAGARPSGPHGSRFAPILVREYQQADPVTESPQSAALCYMCHVRSRLLTGGRFPHDAHLRGPRAASCAVCHDAHGSRRHVGLINFMLWDAAGQAVVASNRQGTLEFRSVGAGRGECSLMCHGEEHVRRGY